MRAEVRFGYDRVRGFFPGTDAVGAPEKVVFVWDDDDHDVVRVLIPPTDEVGLFETELESGVSYLCGLEANGKIGTGDDVELLGLVSLGVVHVVTLRWRAVVRQAPR